jgi:hypothetical protein
MKKRRRIADEEGPTVDLAISPEKVCFLIVKAREFDAKEAVTEPDPGSNPTDDMDASVLEDHEDDPVAEEMMSAIHALCEDEQIDLVAIAWLGRGDYTVDDWALLRAAAEEAHNRRTASYLIGMPQLGDYLEEGLALLGRSCAEYEIGRL